MTGREAVLEATGETFAEAAMRRNKEGPPDPTPQSESSDCDMAPDEVDELHADEQTGATSREEVRP